MSRPHALPRAAVAALLGTVLAGSPVRGQSLDASVSKPLMGENYDRLTGVFALEARLPGGPGDGWIFSGSLAQATAGRTRSVTFANPSVGAWTTVRGIPVEASVTVPLLRELGDDDFASDVLRLSDLQHRERYLEGVWSVSAAATPRRVFAGGSSAGAYLGTIAELPHGDRDLVLRARYRGDLRLRFSSLLALGAAVQGSVRMTGSGGLDERAIQDLVVSVLAPTVRWSPELSFLVPLDIDLQDYVSGVFALRLHF